MKRTLLAGACAAALCAGSGSALADGTYLSIAGGGGWAAALYDEPNTPASSGCATCGFKDLSLDTGFAGSAAIGFLFAPGFRLEGELGLRGNRVHYTVPDTPDFTTDFEGNLAGRGAIFSAMMNAWIDIPTGGPITPYIGAGVGAANVSMNFTNSDDNGGPENGDVNANQLAFAYQLGAGAAIAMTQNVALTLDYRFLGTSGVWLPTGQGDDWGVKSVSNQSVMVGLRFNLGPHSMTGLGAN
jgi:opacity protein-like surface antigen